MSISVSFSKKQTENREGPIDTIEGTTSAGDISITFACTFWGAVTGTPAATVWRNKVDVTTDAMPTGGAGPTTSGYVVTLKPITKLATGRYAVYVQATVEGDKVYKRIILRVSKRK